MSLQNIAFEEIVSVRSVPPWFNQIESTPVPTSCRPLCRELS